MTGAHQRETVGGFHLLAQQIRQFQIVEEYVEKFLLGQRELKAVLAFASLGGFRAAFAALALRPLDPVALLVFLVSRQHMVTLAMRGRGPDLRLLQPVGFHPDTILAAQIADAALAGCFADRLG